MTELREHWQRDDLLCHSLGHREIALLVTDMGVGLLQVQRNWIVDARADARFRQAGLQRVAVLHPYNIEMINPACPVSFARKHDRFVQFAEKLMVALCKRT